MAELLQAGPCHPRASGDPDAAANAFPGEIARMKLDARVRGHDTSSSGRRGPHG
jgi:hypothetical protein